MHPGETRAELLALIRGPLARVRRELRGEAQLGAGLWLPATMAEALAREPEAAEEVRAALAAGGLFAFTVNAFPMGGFHAAEVKERVYRPTWAEEARLRYTEAACLGLAALLPDGARGSVSTVPLGYKAFGEAAQIPFAAAQLGRLAARLERLEAETGRSISLALEPEPLATLETTPECLEFLREQVFVGEGHTAFVAAGGSPRAAEGALRRRIGLCVDTCHLACGYEDLEASLAAIEAAGVLISKVQLSSALELRAPGANPGGLERLLGFSEPRYLHQTLAETPRGVVAVPDLPQVLDARGALRAELRDASRLRTHFHVPLCWEGDADGVLGTTRPELEAALAGLAARCDHLEVETYTFGVLPEAERARYEHDPVRMIVAELAWVEAALAARGIGVR